MPDFPPAVKDFSSKQPHLLIAVGGGFGGLAIPPFEFFNLAKELPIKKLFIRDLDTLWYHRGLRETGELRKMLVDSFN